MHVVERGCQYVPRLQVVGIQAQGLSQLGDGRGRITTQAESQAKSGVGFRRLRI